MFGDTRFLVLQCTFAILLISSLTACSGGAGSSQPTAPTLTSISVTPATPSVAAGLTQQFKATGTYSDSSTADLTNAVLWTSGTTGVATVNSSGLATSKTQGSSLITAAFSSVSGSTTLTVTAATLVSFSISPANATAQIGSAATQQFSAIETYTDASTKDVTNSTTLAVTNPWIASISGTGAASVSRGGYTAITAVYGSLTATANFTVLASPRYLYVSSLVGRYLTRMTVNGSTGQPRFTGYIKTGNYTNILPSCLSSDPAGQHAYLASQVAASGGSGLINIYTINTTTGQLTPYAGNPYAVAEPTGCISFEPSGKFAYATAPKNNALVTFSVNSNGTLTLANTITLPDEPGGLVIDPLGKFLYVPTEYVTIGQSTYAYGYSINSSTGGLTPIAGMPFLLPTASEDSISIHPSGNYAYFADYNSSSISEYTVNRTTGLLSAVSSATVSPCSNPSAPQFSPDGAHAYIYCQEDNHGSLPNAPLVSFSVGSTGQLTQIGTVSADVSSKQMAVDPSGKFLYLLGSGSDYTYSGSNSYTVASNVLMAYQLGSDGTPTLVNEIAGMMQEESLLLAGGASPVTWTPTYAYISSSGDNKLTSYAVQLDGSLNLVQSSSVAVAPFSATLLPWGSVLPWGSDLLLASTAGIPNLTSYIINNGAFTPGHSFGLATQPGGLVIDPLGQIGYGSDSSTGLIYEYADGTYIPGDWGNTYSPAPPTPMTYTAQAGAGPVITDPSGRYLIVANQTAKSISMFGLQGEATIAPLALSYTPLAIAMDPTGNLLFVSGSDLQLHLLVSNGLGLLTDTSDAALSGSESSLAIDPGGHFVYTAGAAGLNAFSINQTTHILAPITLNLPVSLANATGVFIEPSGQFLYVSVSTSSLNALYRFSINTDGTLTASSTAPVATPNHATSMVFSEQIQ
jgi:6-phosphogluconolactonase (cycloisomerase 2 family)